MARRKRGGPIGPVHQSNPHETDEANGACDAREAFEPTAWPTSTRARQITGENMRGQRPELPEHKYMVTLLSSSWYRQQSDAVNTKSCLSLSHRHYDSTFLNFVEMTGDDNSGSIDPT